MDSAEVSQFVQRWERSGGAERANYALFLSELCDLLQVARPYPAQPNEEDNAYVLDRHVVFQNGDGSVSDGWIDLYKRGCFVLETKQGVEKDQKKEALSQTFRERSSKRKKGVATRGTTAWDDAMICAHGQAQQYARALPATEGRPPFIIVVDVGYTIELYSEFTRTGGAYVPFPDPRNHRIQLRQLSDPAVRETLRQVWLDPLSLDPSRRSAKVTREIAGRLALLAKSLESSGHDSHLVAEFLMRCIFTLFAEDVGLLPNNGFSQLLEDLRGRTDTFKPLVEEIWSKMSVGGFSTALKEYVQHFNGGLFEEATALPLTEDQFELLIEAGKADWRDVEPAIFGTLLERALDPVERHKLGAHYTPRAYVERLVLPTVIEPLRKEWEDAHAAAVTLAKQGKLDEAVREVKDFHHPCAISVFSILPVAQGTFFMSPWSTSSGSKGRSSTPWRIWANPKACSLTQVIW